MVQKARVAAAENPLPGVGDRPKERGASAGGSRDHSDIIVAVRMGAANRVGQPADADGGSDGIARRPKYYRTHDWPQSAKGVFLSTVFR